jgi:hypothetical protein
LPLGERRRRRILAPHKKRAEAHVPDYRFYLLDGRGHVLEVRDFACADDAAADAFARRLMAAEGNVRGVEAWLKPRLIAQIGQSRDAGDQSAGPPSTSIASTFSG